MRPVTAALLPLLASLAISPAAFAETGGIADGEASARIEAYLNAAHKLNRFSGAVLVARGGKIVLSKGYGMANYELDVPATPRTKFRIGSLTKQFTAMAVLMLEAEGKLKVTDPVNAFFPDYPEGGRITIHHLLTHTSGIPNLTDFPDYTSTMGLPTPVSRSIDKFKGRPLEFAPGEKFAYSNSGYILLGAILEKVTGRTYEEILRERIFRPLGMDDSGYDHASTILKGRASGYEFPADRMVNASYVDMSVPFSAGALYSTVEDLYRWDRALTTEKLLPKAARTRMFTPYKDGFAYGWIVGTVAGRPTIRHSGGVNGFTAEIQRFPGDDACVVVLSNFSVGFTQQIGADLSGILFGLPVELPKEKEAVKLPPAVLDTLVGRYQLEGTPVVFEIVREGDGLLAKVPQQPPVMLTAESETKFFMKAIGFEVTFVKDATGRVTHFVLLQGKRETKGVKID